MRALVAFAFMLLLSLPAAAQIPAEWETAAQAVIGDLEKDTPRADKPWTGETRQGWNLARTWRQHNNGNVEIILAEYLTFTALCREAGCSGSTIEGKSHIEMAQDRKSTRLNSSH